MPNAIENSIEEFDKIIKMNSRWIFSDLDDLREDEDYLSESPSIMFRLYKFINKRVEMEKFKFGSSIIKCRKKGKSCIRFINKPLIYLN